MTKEHLIGSVGNWNIWNIFKLDWMGGGMIIWGIFTE